VYDAICSGKLSPTRFSQTEVHPKEASDQSIDWIFLIDTLNFSFWSYPDAPKWEVAYHGKVYTGYFALCAAVNRAIEVSITILH